MKKVFTYPSGFIVGGLLLFLKEEKDCCLIFQDRSGNSTGTLCQFIKSFWQNHQDHFAKTPRPFY